MMPDPQASYQDLSLLGRYLCLIKATKNKEEGFIQTFQASSKLRLLTMDSH